MKKTIWIVFSLFIVMAMASCAQSEAEVTQETDKQAEASEISAVEATEEVSKGTKESVEGEPSETDEKPSWITVMVAYEGYQEDEFAGVAEAIKQSAYSMNVVSTQTGEASGSGGGSIEIETAIGDVNEYGLGVVIIGGSGSYGLWDNAELIALVRLADENSDLIAAICAAPGVLANAGVLEGATACWYNSPDLDEIMESVDCEDSGEPVTQYENVITGNGPDAAPAFGQEIVAYLDTL